MSRGLGKTERKILDTLTELEPGNWYKVHKLFGKTIRNYLNNIEHIIPETIMKSISRLERKGYIESNQGDMKYTWTVRADNAVDLHHPARGKVIRLADKSLSPGDEPYNFDGLNEKQLQRLGWTVSFYYDLINREYEAIRRKHDMIFDLSMALYKEEDKRGGRTTRTDNNDE